ncbi:phage tail length tape measure protein [Listeria monocytogenes]|uniref:phage tail tape measure protein n=1 Tax=Listeria monocytogenes TaxID=1639 RepID=UPI0007C8D9EE|nr:phage tail tape measure protein [Listeria monocytogenes]ANE39121.1 phage tail length tape measure protein [Listeria monocytogenes]HAC1300937.1 phage tail tape measure protein [Listeria monocytogenes]HAC1363507.1 phage tail tape measure protein [Listeria monocytogenes]HAC1446557.1 phage tail tape measure protein [Listeria monocytogenes]HAC1473147.1 phage tail tape measure protein [Listeria monocytogenes]
MNKLQGLSINLDLDATRVDEGMKGLKRTLGSVNSEMKANLSAFGKGEKTLSRYETELDGLNKKLSVQSKMVSQTKNDFKDLEKRNASLNGELKESNKTLTESKKRYEQLQTSGTATTKELKAAEKEVKTNEKAYNNLNKELQDMPKSLTNAQKAVYKETASYNNLQRKVDTTTEAFKKLRREQAIKSSPFGKMTQQLDQYQKKLESISNKSTRVGRQMTLGVTTPVLAGFGAATKSAVEFNNQIQGMSALLNNGTLSSGELKIQLSGLSKASKKWAVEYGVSTNSINNGMEEIIKKGYSYEQTLGAMPSILDAAKASGDDFNTVMKNSTSILEQYGLKVESTEGTLKNTQRVTDSLTYVANATSAGFSDMGTAMEYVGPVAHGLNISLEQTASAIGLMSNNGIEGEKAGTALRGMLTRLLKPSKQNVEGFDALGISFRAFQKGSLTLPDLLDKIKKNTEDLTDSQRTALIAQAFGTEAQTGVNILVNQGADALRNLTNETKNADGYTHKLAKTMNETAAANVKKFQSGLKVLGITLGNELLPAVTPIVKSLTKWTEEFGKLSPSTKKFIVMSGLLAASFGPIALGLGAMSKGAAFAINNVKKLTAALAKNSVAATENAIISRADGAAMSTVGKGTKGKGLINGLGNLIGLGGKKGAGLKGAAKSADYAKDIAMYSKGGRIGKYIGAAGKVGKGVPVLGTALAATQLIGINKKNAGDKAGSAAGSLAGGAAGAAIGTAIAPGIGTAIGAAVGGIAGTKFGQAFGKKIQKEIPEYKAKFDLIWEALSFSAKEHPILLNPVNQINDQIKMAKAGYAAIKDVFANPLKTDISGKGISKDTAKNVNSYKTMSQNAISELKYLEMSGDVITKSTSAKISKNYNGMVVLVEKSFEKTKKSTDKNLNTLSKNSMLSEADIKAVKEKQAKIQKLSLDEVKKNNEKIQKLNKDMAAKNADITKKEKADIKAINDKAAKEGRVLTASEEQQITSIKRNAANQRKASNQSYSNQIQTIAKKQETAVVSTLSKSAKEQKLILGKLKDSSGKLSAEQASKVVKESKRSKDGAVKEANKKYKEVVAAADKEYYVNGTITKKQHDDIVKKAKSQKNKSVSEAKKMHNGVVDQAKKQASGHLKQVDWETGESLSKWDNFKAGLAKVINSVTGGINKVLKFFSLPTIPEWKPAGYNNNTKTSKSSSKKRTSYGSQLAMDYTGSNNASGQIMAGEEGFEIAYNKRKAQAQILGANGAEITHVAPGTKILNHADSKKVMQGGLGKALPGFASGNSTINDFLSDAWDGTKAVAGKVVDFSKKAFDWAAHPIKNLNKLFGGLSAGVKMGNDGNLGSDVLNYLKNSIGSPLEKMLSGFKETAPVAGPAGKGASAWSSVIKKAALAMKVDLSGGELKGIIAQIHRESGGNEKITQSSVVVDVNTLSGNPAKGLLQYIPQTFNAYRMKGHNNIFSGYDQLLAFFNNSSWRNDLPYGKRGWGPRGHRRFANGGFVNKNEMIEVAENNKPEVVIPLTRKNRAVQLIKKTKEIIGINDGGSVVVNSPDNSEMVLLLQQQNQILMQLLQKNSDVYLDVDKVGKLVEAVITKTQNNRISRKDRVQGVRTTWQK